jgi:hypothetical protein
MIAFWPAACEFIDEARAVGGRVLVHCAGGHSRSGSTAIAYMMRSLDLELEDALAKAKERRASIMPNPGFRKQLQIFRRLRFQRPSSGEFSILKEGSMERLPRQTGDVSKAGSIKQLLGQSAEDLAKPRGKWSTLSGGLNCGGPCNDELTSQGSVCDAARREVLVASNQFGCYTVYAAMQFGTTSTSLCV